MSIPSTFKPVTLQGDILAMSDDMGETTILNWETGAYATLQHAHNGQGVWQFDSCMQVVFASQSILVVRARSIHLFPYPILKQSEEGVHQYTPITRHSFGWVDGVSVTMMGRRHENSPLTSRSNWQRPLSILVRAETDDPWSSDVLSLELYTLNPNPYYTPSEPSEPQDDDADTTISPYIFPPVLTSKVKSLRGAVQCTNVLLGRFGTAIWIQPRHRWPMGLYWSTDDPALGCMSLENLNESLVATVFPGSLTSPAHTDGEVKLASRVVEMKGKAVCWNDRNNWTSLDYDEDVGRIILGSGFGQITILDM